MPQHFGPWRRPHQYLPAGPIPGSSISGLRLRPARHRFNPDEFPFSLNSSLGISRL